jgi:di/tripeptidase
MIRRAQEKAEATISRRRAIMEKTRSDSYAKQHFAPQAERDYSGWLIAAVMVVSLVAAIAHTLDFRGM